MEDDQPRPKPALLARPPLDDFSVAALEDYIAALKAEIIRVEAAISGKQGARATAESMFRRG
jgi:uncharacterized small protein (DUF1192 family)